jgi:uncharacterized SAM-binding protein YcdF (DUF218 family)
MDQLMKAMRKLFIVVIVFVVGSGSLFMLFVFFCRQTYNNTVFDNIAVLTGEYDRIIYAFNLAKLYRPKNIFISGVHEKTTLHDILAGKPVPDVRVILGKQAKNTRENAKEIDEWVRQNNISEILLITSDYHMIRSIAELRHVNDKLKIYPCTFNSQFNLMFFWRCFKEFYKMIYIQCRNLQEKILSICCS